MGPSKAKRPTKSERARMARIVELGCVACRKAGFGLVPAEIHHLLDGGVRRGHSFTIGLCQFHHRGVWTPVAGKAAGPCLSAGSRLFRAWHGSDDELLAYQNSLLAEEGGK